MMDQTSDNLLNGEIHKKESGAYIVGGAVAKCLVHWTPDRVVRVRALAGALRCALGQDT